MIADMDEYNLGYCDILELSGNTDKVFSDFFCFKNVMMSIYEFIESSDLNSQIIKCKPWTDRWFTENCKITNCRHEGIFIIISTLDDYELPEDDGSYTFISMPPVFEDYVEIGMYIIFALNLKNVIDRDTMINIVNGLAKDNPLVTIMRFNRIIKQMCDLFNVNEFEIIKN